MWIITWVILYFSNYNHTASYKKLVACLMVQYLSYSALELLPATYKLQLPFPQAKYIPFFMCLSSKRLWVPVLPSLPPQLCANIEMHTEPEQLVDVNQVNKVSNQMEGLAWFLISKLLGRMLLLPIIGFLGYTLTTRWIFRGRYCNTSAYQTNHCWRGK